MRLYHFTDAWPEIKESDVILTSWARNGSAQSVHLSQNDDAQTLPWGTLRDSRYRIAVDIPEADVLPWIPWARRYLPPEEQWSLAAPSSGVPIPNQWNGQPDEWFISEHPISSERWVEVTDLRAGETVWRIGDRTE